VSTSRSFWSWLLNLPPPPPETRLSEDGAVALAAGSAQVAALGRALPVASVRRGPDGRLAWRVSNAGVGAQWWVEVDDATGAVGPVHHVPTR